MVDVMTSFFRNKKIFSEIKRLSCVTQNSQRMLGSIKLLVISIQFCITKKCQQFHSTYTLETNIFQQK